MPTIRPLHRVTPALAVGCFATLDTSVRNDRLPDELGDTAQGDWARAVGAGAS